MLSPAKPILANVRAGIYSVFQATGKNGAHSFAVLEAGPAAVSDEWLPADIPFMC